MPQRGPARKRGLGGRGGTRLYRAKVVEYRVGQHKKVLDKRLAAVRSAPPLVTTVVTAGRFPAGVLEFDALNLHHGIVLEYH